jgi:hypothetical protein
MLNAKMEPLFGPHVSGDGMAISCGTTPEVMSNVVTPGQPFAPVPMTMYCVERTGAAVTDGPVVLPKPYAGYHSRLLAPVAVSVMESPPHTKAGSGETTIVGLGNTVSVAEPVAVHPFENVAVTVYVYTPAVADHPVIAYDDELPKMLAPDVTVQLYVNAPVVAVNGTAAPLSHIVALLLTVTLHCATVLLEHNKPLNAARHANRNVCRNRLSTAIAEGGLVGHNTAAPAKPLSDAHCSVNTR